MKQESPSFRAGSVQYKQDISLPEVDHRFVNEVNKENERKIAIQKSEMEEKLSLANKLLSNINIEKTLEKIQKEVDAAYVLRQEVYELANQRHIAMNDFSSREKDYEMIENAYQNSLKTLSEDYHLIQQTHLIMNSDNDMEKVNFIDTYGPYAYRAFQKWAISNN